MKATKLVVVVIIVLCQKRPSCCCKEIESKHERLMVVRDLQGVSVNKKAEHLIASPRRRNQNGVRWFCFKPTFFFVLSFDTFRLQHLCLLASLKKSYIHRYLFNMLILHTEKLASVYVIKLDLLSTDL